MEVVRSFLTLFLFAVIDRHFSFALDNEEHDYGCSKFACGEIMLDRMIRTEFKVKEMDKEIAKTHGAFISLLEGQNRRLQEIFDSFKKDRKHVAFSAYDPVNKYPSDGEDIVFQNVQLNEGNAYNVSTGEFTAPVEGVYEFSASICNSQGKFIVYAIAREGETVALSTQWDDTDSCNSVNGLAMVNAGERVTVNVIYVPAAFQFYENVHRRNSFTGVLLHKK